ncbi:branched-chain amino acid ABC transporter permease [Phytohabitans kaempferiae]|uniref:Branched-chain amino acid ABC transporter permease n=1 Tax=Phytohabitans kaempferiae TaxID=1620943 RepID=A0ABV6MBK6_9ACTN
MTTALAPTTPTRPAPAKRRRSTAGHVLVAAAVVAAIALPAVVDAYTISIASTALVLAALAVSTQLVTGVAGLPSLGQAAYLGVGAYTAALLANTGLRVGPVLLAAAAAAGAGAAALSGPLLLRTRGTAFLMTSFAIGELVRTTASLWAEVTGGDDGLHAPPVTIWPAGPPLEADGYIYLYLLAAFLVLMLAVAVLLRSRLAVIVRAFADGEARLQALGYHTPAALLAWLVIAGAVAGMAGGMLAAAHQYVSPADLSLDMSALALLAAAIGVGSMRGAIVGTVLVVAVRDLAGVNTSGHALALLGLTFLAVAYQQPLRSYLRTVGRRR